MAGPMQTSTVPSWPSSQQELRAGFRVVFYEFCVSFVIVTLRRPSRLYLLAPGESGLMRGLPYTLISLLFGWWGVPWGLIDTPLAIVTNLSGGRDITEQITMSSRS